MTSGARAGSSGIGLRGSRSGVAFLVCLAFLGAGGSDAGDDYGRWMEKPREEWPRITMVNQMEYTDKAHPIGGCAFLLDTGNEILAATAKHVLTYFKSESMSSVSFGGTLKEWRMFPKDSPDDVVVVDELVNEDADEPLEGIPSSRDWLLFTIKDRSDDVQPLRFRSTPLESGEEVFVVGWKYSDKDGPQRIYEGRYLRQDRGSILIDVKELAHNTMPGLSGSPVIDAHGYIIGLMSTGFGKLQRLAPVDYPKAVLLETRSRTGAD